MDKITLTKHEVDLLLAWRDAHNALVRYAPAPIKAIRIILTDDQVEYVAVREKPTKLRLSLSYRGKHYGTLLMHQRFDLKWGLVKDTLTSRHLFDPEIHQSLLTVYASLMALMVHGREFVLPPTQNALTTQSRANTGASERNAKTNSPRKANSTTKSSSFTYILRTTKDGLQLTTNNHHASPSGIFSVRGHYRHYKSGKIVWIAEYKKGTGRKKNTSYRMGTQQALQALV